MKKLYLLIGLTALLAACAPKQDSAESLKSALKGKFLIGVAISESQIRHEVPKADSLITLHFNAIEPENCMKSEEIHPEKGVYNWELADKYVDYGTSQGLAVYGHCLIWHSQLAPWFCVDENGNDVSPEELKARMKDHIQTIVGRYKGRIKGWDVVNEAILDDGSWRESPFYRILGEDYIPLAFRYANEADPDAELYYNDYGMHHRARVETVIRLVKKLKESGIRIDAVGFQGHFGMDYPDMEEFEKSLVDVAATGADICITEWDMSILPTINRSADLGDMSIAQAAAIPEFAEKLKAQLNPYPDGVPQERFDEWTDRAARFWDIFITHSDVIRRVNVWGLTDADSWKNGWPVASRVDYPLLFDRNYKQKAIVDRIISSAR